ncbi:hypothetical protein C0993_007856, partial [Termitomyces sp. T159_Od127]
MEIACLVWARVLLNLVYQFIEKDVNLHGPLPFCIPQMHFIEAALAIEEVEDGKDAHAVLPDEVIGESEGRFRKYLNNVSPVPLPLSCKENMERGHFLAFSQHVQYFKTWKWLLYRITK